MPTNRRQRLQPRRHEAHAERTVHHLLTGHDFVVIGGPDLTDAELRDAWQAMRDELLAQHIAEHPGSRPWGWWRWDAPEPRRQVADGPEAIGEPLWFGMPQQYKGIPPEGTYESEANYLRRLGLLTAEEETALATK